MGAHPLIEFLRREPDMIDRLLAVHVDDGTGRCAVCTGGGQSGWSSWPCTIHAFARAAWIRPCRSPAPGG